MDQNKIFLALINDRTFKYMAISNLSKKQNRNENILKDIDSLLNKIKKRVKDIKGIIVVNGPGSFVGIRVALSVANTFAWLLRIPAAGISLNQGSDNKALIKKGIDKLLKTKKGNLVKPFYGKEPNISSPHTLLLK